MSATTARPGPDRYAPFFAGYIARVADGDILHTLATQLDATLSGDSCPP